ncbi:MAG: hypothetical protein JO345_22365 [Streptosporangiaceae bacterium]|nr:hypothetical protein [Streptosporangiaceae bacterium]
MAPHRRAGVHFAPPALAKGKPKAPLPARSRAISRERAKTATVTVPMRVTPGTARTVTRGLQALFQPGPGGNEAGCAVGVGSPASTVGQDDYLEQLVDVSYQSSVSCDASVAFEAEAFLIDRSPDFNGQIFDGNDISDGTLISADGDTSTGTFNSGVRFYDGARAVESAVEVAAVLTDGSVWGDCATDGTVEVLLCDGVGTDTLDVVYGSGAFDSGLTAACRDFAIPGNPEQARLNSHDSDGVPFSTTIMNGVPEVEDQLVSFRQGLCTLTGPAADFARQRGLALWNAAVTAAKKGEANGDDRPLYWARLGMSLALTQWLPSFTPDTAAAQQQLELASRGMLSANFTSSGPRVLISGFDPFGLDLGCNGGGSDIMNANPSGQSVLRLDGTSTLAGPNGVVTAEVHAVIFPVRYSDFDSGLVENFFRPYLDPASGQLVNLITTVSQGGDSIFDLEFYNGRNRDATGTGDNVCETTTGTPAHPEEPPGLAPGPQFTESTLPVDAIASANPGIAMVHYPVMEIRHQAQGDSGPVSSDTPTVAATAVEGSGGGFLSNEIAYRVTRLRDELNSPVLTGHIHTPFTTSVDPALAQEFENILASAAQAPPPVRVRVSTDRSIYYVFNPLPAGAPPALNPNAIPIPSCTSCPVYTITGPPNTEVKWSTSINGIETGEIDADYGQHTDANGNLTVKNFIVKLKSTERGTWVRQVRLGNVIATVTFQVF